MIATAETADNVGILRELAPSAVERYVTGMP